MADLDGVTLAQAAELVQYQLHAGIFEHLKTTNHLFGELVWKSSIDRNWIFTRSLSRAAGVWVTDNELLSDDVSTAEKHTMILKKNIRPYAVDNSIEAETSRQNSQTGFQSRQAMSAVSEAAQSGMINGSSTLASPSTKQPYGIKNQVDDLGRAADVDDANGALVNEDLDLAIRQVKEEGKPGSLVFSMAGATLDNFSSYRRANNDPLQYASDRFGSNNAIYRGIPILVDDYILSNEGGNNDRTRVYLNSLDPDVGLIGIYSANMGPMGTRMTRVGELPNYDAIGYRFSWTVAFLIQSALSVYCLKNIKNS